MHAHIGYKDLDAVIDKHLYSTQVWVFLLNYMIKISFHSPE